MKIQSGNIYYLLKFGWNQRSMFDDHIACDKKMIKRMIIWRDKAVGIRSCFVIDVCNFAAVGSNWQICNDFVFAGLVFDVALLILALGIGAFFQASYIFFFNWKHVKHFVKIFVWTKITIQITTNDKMVVRMSTFNFN